MNISNINLSSSKINLNEIYKESIKSGVNMASISIVAKAIHEQPINIKDLKDLVAAQAVSKGVKIIANSMYSDIKERILISTGVQALRNAYLDHNCISIGIGAIEGLGYGVTDEFIKKFNNDGNAAMAKLSEIAGVYATELAQAIAACLTIGNVPCSTFIKRSVLIATLVLVS